ncbi:unnamed protein product [Hymenolepis diminuta]|uniref:G_PROTEIN_RECEP_F1_2 domain-containing protein n=1 Tax=Hymenolepis diminuta TaxID=6216 RepID=A0A0R3S9G7_HYMDI|nr:unnamed protein product [Hymenolepis diminuta]
MLFPIFGYNLTAIPLNLSELEKRLGEPLTECYESVYNIGLISHYFTGIVALVISSVGLIGNILSIGVLTSKYMKGTTTNLYLIGLALSDSLMLLSVILVALRDTRTPVCGKSVWQLWNDAPFIPKLYPICHAFALLFQVSYYKCLIIANVFMNICCPFDISLISSYFLS